MSKVLFLFILATSVCVRAEPTVPVEAKDYQSQLRKFKQSTAPQSFEEVFKAGVVAAKLVVSDLNKYDEETYNRVGVLLEGFVLRREIITYVRPNPNAMLSLVKDKGTPQDIEFLKTLKAVTPDGIRFEFEEPLSDAKYCADIGSGRLTKAYSRINSLSKKIGKSYADYRQAVLQEIESKLINERCICGSQKKYLEELGKFVTRKASAKAKKELGERLKTLEKGVGDFTFHCVH